jgi:hypothetical protein
MVTKTNKCAQVYVNINLVIRPTCFGHSCGHPQGGALWRINTLRYYKSLWGRAMARTVSRRPFTAEDRVRSHVSPCGICGGQSGTGTGFSPSTSVFSCQFHSIGPPLQGKKKKLIIFITGLHNKPQGCGASVASAAGPLTKTKLWTNANVKY